MSPEVETEDVTDILVEAAGGCAVINGEIAMQLEVRSAVSDKRCCGVQFAWSLDLIWFMIIFFAQILSD